MRGFDDGQDALFFFVSMNRRIAGLVSRERALGSGIENDLRRSILMDLRLAFYVADAVGQRTNVSFWRSLRPSLVIIPKYTPDATLAPRSSVPSHTTACVPAS